METTVRADARLLFSGAPDDAPFMRHPQAAPAARMKDAGQLLVALAFGGAIWSLSAYQLFDHGRAEASRTPVLALASHKDPRAPVADLLPATELAASQPLISPVGPEEPERRSGASTQVGSYVNAADAESGWNVLSSRHPALADREHVVVQAELDGTAIFRLRVPAETRSDASALCGAIKDSGGECFTAS